MFMQQCALEIKIFLEAGGFCSMQAEIGNNPKRFSVRNHADRTGVELKF